MRVLLVEESHIRVAPHILRVHGRVEMDILFCIFHSSVSQSVLGDLDPGDLIQVCCGRVPEKMAMDVHTQIPGSSRDNMLNHPERYSSVPAGYKQRPNVPADCWKIPAEKGTECLGQGKY